MAYSGLMVSRILGPGFEPGNFLWKKLDDFCCVVEEKDSGWLCGLADLRFQQDVSLEKHNNSIQDHPNNFFKFDFLGRPRVAIFSVWLVSRSGIRITSTVFKWGISDAKAKSGKVY